MIKKPQALNWISDEAYVSLPNYERALLLASTDVGKTEDPAHTNGGPFVRRLLERVGILYKAPWCAAWVTNKLLDAGVQRSKLPKNPASTLEWYKWAKANGRLYYSKTKNPSRGDLFVYNDGKSGHIGFVTGMSSKANRVFESLEGNTNDEGSREGYETCRRKRSVDSIAVHKFYGFIDMGDI